MVIDHETDRVPYFISHLIQKQILSSNQPGHWIIP